MCLRQVLGDSPEMMDTVTAAVVAQTGEDTSWRYLMRKRERGARRVFMAHSSDFRLGLHAFADWCEPLREGEGLPLSSQPPQTFTFCPVVVL